MLVTGDKLIPAMFYLSRTDPTVPWDAIERLKAGYPALTQRERCEMFLRAVNRDSLAVREWNRLVGTPVFKGLVEKAQIPLYEDAVPALRASLVRVIEDCETAIDEIGGNVAAIINGEYFVIPELAAGGRSPVEREHVVASSVGVAMAYTLKLFLDPRLEFGKLLRQCSWNECGRFAFGQPPRTSGQPPKFYCDGNHRKADTLRQSRERVNAKRAGMSVDKWRAKLARKSK